MSEEEYLYYDNDDSVPPYKEIDPGIPLWLKLVIVILPFWGFATFFVYWNGNFGDWLDRGYWGELQQAAHTTFPQQVEIPLTVKDIESPRDDYDE